jgi:predicted Zn finger-like uncharacterized protein
MYTQCPDCLTVFSLDAETLTQAGGEVQCGHCDQIFHALANLAQELPPEPFSQLPAHEHASIPPRLELAVYRPRPEPSAVLAADDAAEEDFSALVFAPRFARNAWQQDKDAAARSYERRWPWLVVCILLVLLLGGQIAWVQRSALLSDPGIGAWLRASCDVIGCQLPLVRDVDQLQLVARDVEAHPSVPGALMISATLRNDAAFAQPYPVVTLVLSDAQGHHMAMRRLRPAEYLNDAEALRSGLPPGASAALVIEAEDPGHGAVAFDFGFE